ncbi:MAG: SDR family NAD(P)-dependent oxidoreductase [Mycobacterium sp.]|nr:SDR family NAD(P)-dependent oxidoreductase [Mycobacterium sp.]
MSWHPDQIPDQSGRRFVITGAAGGLGAQTTRVLAGKGATVVMACRNTTKAEQVASHIDGDVRVEALDLADLGSVRKFADQAEPCDVLINNAGLMRVPFARTAEGFEMQFGVNHLGHFALTGLLLDRIADRVVTLSSIAHQYGRNFVLDDITYTHRRYRRSHAYFEAKLANLLFARELQRRLAGSAKRSYAVHPGASATDLFTRTQTPWDWVSKPVVAVFGHRPALAAQSTLFAATEPEADPETYWGPTWLFGLRGPVRAAPSSRLSQDRALARRLWELSEKATGVTFPV